jgi:hypothetical protein
MMLTELADVLRAAGLKVQEVAGWKTRGHGEMDDVRSIICHHTAGAKTGNYPSLGVVRDGRPGLDGPLAQLGVARDGTWLVIAAGLCWHAGVVFESWQGNRHAIGIEAEGTGVDPWPAVQYASYVAGVRALADHYDVPTARVLGHKEVAKPLGRKSDPNFSMGNFRTAVVNSNDQEELSMSDVQKILDYQKACTIQIQNNTRQLLNNAVAGILDGVQKYAVAQNNFTRQTDETSDDERQAELTKLRDELAASLGEVLKAVSTDVPDPQ